MIEDGITGLLVKNQDVNELAIKLEQIITEDKLRNAFHKMLQCQLKDSQPRMS